MFLTGPSLILDCLSPPWLFLKHCTCLKVQLFNHVTQKNRHKLIYKKARQTAILPKLFRILSWVYLDKEGLKLTENDTTHFCMARSDALPSVRRNALLCSRSGTPRGSYFCADPKGADDVYCASYFTSRRAGRKGHYCIHCASGGCGLHQC